MALVDMCVRVSWGPLQSTIHPDLALLRCKPAALTGQSFPGGVARSASCGWHTLWSRPTSPSHAVCNQPTSLQPRDGPPRRVPRRLQGGIQVGEEVGPQPPETEETTGEEKGGLERGQGCRETAKGQQSKKQNSHEA